MRRLYAALLNPREHPDDDRRHVRPPSWETFGNRARFTSLRGIPTDGDRLVGFVDEIARYVDEHQLGDILWPSYPILFAENLGEFVAEVKRRGLFVFDIWGYVPGSGPGGYWQQFDPPREALDLLERELGDHWLGMDVGEQDGRYVGGYASQMTPRSADRFEQYRNFQSHFERMCDDLGNRMSTLVSLNFGHYFLKEGVYSLIGAETAQALPNGQVYYAFIRGAGKQYGVPWFGNASIYNRWGFKTYGSEGQADGYAYGPTKGSSLNLMKRLLYSHLFYNCVLVGFEAGWFEGEKLSPLGRIQQAARRWSDEVGSPGVMLTPVALMCDFASGWSFPRHLYTGDVYRVWGNLPYEPGDYLTDGALDLLYPGYQDASYFHDETGFIAPTPYGDIADCLLSDAPGWLLERYGTLVVAGGLSGGAEIRDKLAAYVAGGGHLVITAGNLAQLPGGIAGVSVGAGFETYGVGVSADIGGKRVVESAPFVLYDLAAPENALRVVRFGDRPAALAVDSGKGTLTVLASPFGVGSAPSTDAPVTSEVDKPLPKPFPLLTHVRAVLGAAFRDAMPFGVGDGLSLIVCRKSAGEYTLGVCNNALEPRPLRIESFVGDVVSVTELPLDESEKGAVGYLPDGFESARVGSSGHGQIAGGDARVYSVSVRERGVAEIPHAAPPPRPRNRALPLRNIASLKAELLRRPTFFEHYDGVMLDARYLRDRTMDAVRAESGWVRRQGVRALVDFASGVNLYPDIRLIDNVSSDYRRSRAVLTDTLDKMAILGSGDLLLSLHRHPENNFTGDQTDAGFVETLRQVCGEAVERGIVVHLRMSHGKPPWSLSDAVAWVGRAKASNLRVAASAAAVLASGASPGSVSAVADRIAVWLVSAPEFDVAGHLWNAHAPIARLESVDALAGLLRAAPDAVIAFDALYSDLDAEYRDARLLESLV